MIKKGSHRVLSLARALGSRISESTAGVVYTFSARDSSDVEGTECDRNGAVSKTSAFSDLDAVESDGVVDDMALLEKLLLRVHYG